MFQGTRERHGGASVCTTVSTEAWLIANTVPFGSYNYSPPNPIVDVRFLYYLQVSAATYGSFRKLGVPHLGVLILRILLFRVLHHPEPPKPLN